MKVKFEILGTPKGKGRHRVQVLPNGKVHTYTPDATAKYENLVKVMYMQQCGKIRLTGALQADIKVFYAIPQSWSKKRREEACKGEKRPQIKPDCDNVAKVILDSLNGVAYDDDKQVVTLSVNKYYSDTARVEVELSEVEVNCSKIERAAKREACLNCNIPVEFCTGDQKNCKKRYAKREEMQAKNAEEKGSGKADKKRD